MEENKDIGANVPVKVDDEIEVEIISKGDRGDGVGKVNDFILFVANANVGEKVKVIVEKVFKRFGIARKMIVEEDESNNEENTEVENGETEK